MKRHRFDNKSDDENTEKYNYNNSTRQADSDNDNNSNIIHVWAGGTCFTVFKNILTNASPYFRAMFQGGFKEENQKEIHIKLVSAATMEFIINYMEDDKITNKYQCLIEEDLTAASNFFNAALYFQISNLPNKIEKILVNKLSIHNWYSYWLFAEEMSLKSFKHKCVCFALYKFYEVRQHIECIESVEHLHWYLSHKYLNTQNEYDVFETGCEWLKKYNNDNENNLLAVLSCLDYNRFDGETILKMLSNECVRSSATAVEVLKRILRQIENKYDRTLKYTDENQKIVDDLTIGISKRIKPEIPCIAGKVNNESYLFAVDTDKGKLTKYLKLAGDSWWGYSVVSWDDFNIVIVCGEIGKGRGVWNKDVIQYNILTEKWKKLNTEPNASRRHAGAVVNKNYLYLVGGVGPFRQTEKSVLKYDMIKDTFVKLPDLPEACQLPVVGVINDDIYVAAEHLYYFKESTNDWINLGKLRMRHTSIFSISNSLFFTTNWSKDITHYQRKHRCYDFVICESKFVSCCHNIAGACNSGNSVFAFTEDETEMEGTNPLLSVKEYVYDESNNPKTIKEYPREEENFISNRSGCFMFVNYNIKDESISNNGLKWLK